MKFIIATKNKKKLTELERILEPFGIMAISEADLDKPLPEVEETGSTFEENALLKARSAMNVTGLPAIADDSGLCVDILGGEPGVYSARYSGENSTDEQNNQKLLSKLESVKEEERTAKFVCAVCCIFPNGDIISVRGECKGIIAFTPSGSGGFGYDPLFLVDGVSFGELPADKKDKISHRGNALRKLKVELENYLNKNAL